MAIWQYKCCLIPGKALNNETHATRQMLDEEEWDFEGLKLDDLLRKKLSRILPEAKSWHEELAMWGSEAGNRIEIWVEDGFITSVRCRFDCRNPSKAFIESICKLSQDLKCKIVYQRYLDILPTNPNIVFREITSSVNRKIIENPDDILPKIAAEINKNK